MQILLFQIMVSFGVDIESHNVEGQTPMHIASISGQLDVVKWLALNGANVRTKDMGGRYDRCLLSLIADVE